MGWSSCSQRAARVAPRAYAEVLPHTERISSHQPVRHPSTSLQLQYPGDENADPRGSIPSFRMWKPQPHWVIANWLGFMESVRGESCPSSQRRSPAAPGEDKFLYSGQKPFHFSTTSTNGDETADPPGRYRPERCGNPNPTDRLLMG